MVYHCCMKIGELAKQAAVNIDTIRYYEQRQLLAQPKRTPSGYRIYSKQDLIRLEFILHAKALGFTLEEIKMLLSLRSDQSSCEQVKQIASSKAQEIALRIQSLSNIRDTLLELAEQCGREGKEDVCPILKAMEKDHE